MTVHTCHWPGCRSKVPPSLWGCRRHWFMLPKHLRDMIWSAYVPGQEVRKDPSDKYLNVAGLVQRWIRENHGVTKTGHHDEKKRAPT